MSASIDLYTWPTPNGHKIHIMLEECGLPYNVHAIDIGAGDPFRPDALKSSPNNQDPGHRRSTRPRRRADTCIRVGCDHALSGWQDGPFSPGGYPRQVRRAAMADVPDARPAVQRALKVLANRRKPQLSDKDRANLFGQAQTGTR